MKTLTILLFSVSILARAQVPVPGTVPLRFNPEASKLEIEGPSLTWNLPSLGGESFSESEYGFQLSPESKNSDQFKIQFKMSPKFFNHSSFYLYDSKANVLASADVPTGASQFEKKLSKSSLGMSGSGYKACLFSQANPQHHQLLCTASFNDALELAKSDPKLVINGINQNRQGLIQIEEGKPIEINWVQESGLSLRLTGQVPKTTFTEIVQISPTSLLIKSFGSSPVANSKQVTAERSAFWQKTVGDLRIFRETQITSKASYVPVRDPGGLVYTYQLNAAQIPDEKNRLSLDPNSPHSTYAKSLRLRGRKPKAAKMSSTELSVKSADESEVFEWTFASPKKYEFNLSKIKSETELNGVKSQDIFDYEVMRMPSTYVSANLGLYLGTEANVGFVTELHGTHWFSEPFGESYYLSRNRWGLNLGFLSSLTSSISNAGYSAKNADLIYRLTPGVESWDESFGITLGGTEVSYSTSKAATLVGPGILWSRSLPDWFNYILGISDFFRKPKWVDISAHYYLTSMDSNISGNSMQVRALARIEISQSSYFEAGWGILTTDYIDNRAQTRTTLAAARGYFGLGYRF